MSCYDVLGAEQYKAILFLPEEDKRNLLNLLIKDSDRLIEMCRDYPTEITYPSIVNENHNIRFVFDGQDKLEFVMTVLTLYLK